MLSASLSHDPKHSSKVVSSLVILYPFAFWATSQLQYATFWQESLGWKPSEMFQSCMQ